MPPIETSRCRDSIRSRQDTPRVTLERLQRPVPHRQEGEPKPSCENSCNALLSVVNVAAAGSTRSIRGCTVKYRCIVPARIGCASDLRIRRLQSTSKHRPYMTCLNSCGRRVELRRGTSRAGRTAQSASLNVDNTNGLNNAIDLRYLRINRSTRTTWLDLLRHLPHVERADALSFPGHQLLIGFGEIRQILA